MAAAKPDFLEYDWRLDGEPAHFLVDLSLYDRAADGAYPVLAFLACSSNKEGCALSASEQKHIDSFAAKCVKKLDALMAGYIEKDGIRQYYFYLPTKDEYLELRAFAEKQSAFTCRIGGKKEQDWSSYFRILYPDEAKYQTVRNEEQIIELYESGDSDAPRRLNIHLAFPNHPARSRFCEDALSEGFAVGGTDERENEALACAVLLYRICALKKPDVDAVTIQAIRLAEKYGGRLLFWDCPIVPARGR